MKVNLIVGAGQLGSRHLQGLLNHKGEQEVYVLDPSDASLKLAEERANEIAHTHTVHFLNNWEDLPSKFNLVVVATNANIRENIATKLIENYKIDFLILEKVLFQELASFERVKKLIQKHHSKVWVNHPRRMFDTYKNFKKEYLSSDSKIYQVTGGNWGLGCNGLHFIDLFTYLSSSKVVSISTENVNEELLSSKRDGFVEFSGTINGVMEDGSLFQVTSNPGDITAPTITIFDSNSRYLIQEGGTPKIYSFQKENNFALKELDFEMEYQSSLTIKLADSLFEKSNCDLPTYEEAYASHIPFIENLLKTYNSITNLKQTILPIT